MSPEGDQHPMTGDMALALSSDAPIRLTSGDVLEMYQAHGAFLRRLLLRFGIRARDVDDVVQDVFVVALRRAADFRGRSTERTWLCGIAFRVATEHVRRRRFREILGWHIAEPETSESASPERALERSEAHREVQRILDTLSPKKRAVLVLFEIEQLTGEEISQIVGCPIKTVWTRLFHARREFAAELRRRGLLDSEHDDE